MKYNGYSKQDLIKKIHSMEKEKTEDANISNNLLKSQYLATGYLGPWQWDIKSDRLILHPLQEEMFKLDFHESMSFDDFTKCIHENHRQFVKKEFDRHLKKEIDAVEIEYQALFNDGNFHWLYHRAEIDEKDSLNQPLHMMGIIMDITERRNTEESLSKEKQIHEKNATLDFLTNLLNRRGFHVQTDSCLRDASVKNQNITIAMFDIDNFKQANDTLGHEHGDQVLKEIACLLKENTRDEDIVSRFGGDEFLLIFIGMKKNEAYNVCDRIRKLVEEKYEDQEVKITLSGGIKEYNNESIDVLIQNVDELLYKAKRNGKNQIVE